jgi:hypothetical protein
MFEIQADFGMGVEYCFKLYFLAQSGGTHLHESVLLRGYVTGIWIFTRSAETK